MTALPGLIMSCDFPGPSGSACLRAVTCAPRVVIPATVVSGAHRPVRIMTTLHACDLHQHAFDVQLYLSADQRGRIERQCRAVRDRDFRPDFEAAFTETVLVTTPEYRDFLTYIGTQLYVPAA